MKKYITIHVSGQNKIYKVENTKIEKEISKFAEEDRSSVRYLPVVTNRGETLKLQWDGNRTMKVLPEYLEDSVSGEIIEVGESFTNIVYPNRVLQYL